MLNILYLILALNSILASASKESSVLEFQNYGFSGYYQQLYSLSDSDDSCECVIANEYATFSGANAPLNAQNDVSVHFRGPLKLSKFAFYTASDYTYKSGSATWNREAYYDGDSAENVTFLTKAGTNNTCLGKALTYAGSDGTSSADSSTVLDSDTLINSNEEYVIFSNVSCEDSGFDNDCGVYRSGIPAYHGYYGDIKMFLFEFEAPDESVITDKNTSNYNLPAIWLLNAKIPRTSQYPTNSNCSCWASGCGEFDIFEVLNVTNSNKFYSTVHDFQGTGDLQTGISVPGYINRDTESSMKGGVFFDSAGTAIVWMSNSTEFDSSLSSSDVESWVSAAGNAVEDTLSSASAAVPSGHGSTAKGDAGITVPVAGYSWLAMVAWALFV